MASTPSTKKQVPLGQPLPWDEATLEVISRINLLDREEADRLFVQANPGPFGTLLYARLEDEEIETG